MLVLMSERERAHFEKNYTKKAHMLLLCTSSLFWFSADRFSSIETGKIVSRICDSDRKVRNSPTTLARCFSRPSHTRTRSTRGWSARTPSCRVFLFRAYISLVTRKVRRTVKWIKRERKKRRQGSRIVVAAEGGTESGEKQNERTSPSSSRDVLTGLYNALVRDKAKVSAM